MAVRTIIIAFEFADGVDKPTQQELIDDYASMIEDEINRDIQYTDIGEQVLGFTIVTRKK